MYDTLYVGGGNTRHIRLELEQNVHIVPNDAGLTGGVRLWDKQLDADFAVGGRQ
jgi:polyphosphate glucokinase